MRKKVAELVNVCQNIVKTLPGVLIEQKPLSVALHYRLNADVGSEICSKAEDLVRKLGGEWRLLQGKMVCEILPAAIDKVSVVKRLCNSDEFSHRKPVYAGDDTTDAQSLLLIRDLQGFAIKVGEGPAENGMIRVESPAQLRRWLAQLTTYSTGQPNQPLQKGKTHPHLKLVGNERTLIISNRVPLPHSKKGGSGGLALAMHSLLRRYGGMWIGWSGKICETPATQEMRHGDITYVVRDLGKKEFELFYLQFCNGTLWSLLHYNIGLLDFSRAAYDAYRNVNKSYAELLLPLLRRGDYLWVHDFHFIPLARYLRELGISTRIGFFLHTPFPSREVLVTLPVHKELMSCLYAYDVIGFQTQKDLQAFEDYADSENIRSYTSHNAPSETIAASFPIGIDTTRFSVISQKLLMAREAQDLKASIADRKLIIGADRLDYSKGIMHRLRAVGDLLNRREDLHKQFTYLQIAPPTREGLIKYAELRSEVESMVGHINGKHTAVDWVPIRFLVRAIKRELLAAFYRLARVGLVTPLRDGMNLVAKEFVAAQDPNDPGVLVLSRFAGAAEELHQALIVNPYDINEISEAIERALLMPLQERQERWHAMFNILTSQTLDKWYQDYLHALTGR